MTGAPLLFRQERGVSLSRHRAQQRPHSRGRGALCGQTGSAAAGATDDGVRGDVDERLSDVGVARLRGRQSGWTSLPPRSPGRRRRPRWPRPLLPDEVVEPGRKRAAALEHKVAQRRETGDPASRAGGAAA